MQRFAVGQRYFSEPEPELGLGSVVDVGAFQVEIDFSKSGEVRRYASDTSVLKRVSVSKGETVETSDGRSIRVDAIVDEDLLYRYIGDGGSAREDELAWVDSFGLPQDRILNGNAGSSSEFDLRYRTLAMRNELRRSPLRGFMGGRVDLLPHQIYILHEFSSRQIPRVLLSDEVGLGKTIEACLIIQRMRAIGRAERVLILVPESLVHQWFVELLRRFNLWFNIYDEERCRAVESGDGEENPFLDEQLILCSIDYLSDNDNRSDQATDAGWDIVVVDEAHHLEWTPERSNLQYDLVSNLSRVSPGLLLLTATPTQLGVAGHFARLRLLDPDRYSDLEAFSQEAEDFESIASIAERIVEGRELSSDDRRQLKRIFNKDLEGLETKLANFESGLKGAKETLLRALLDEHGTGRVVFRNTRLNMKGFPKRKYCPAPLDGGETRKGQISRLLKEFLVECGKAEGGIRYGFSDDCRLDWLVAFLKAKREAKALLICKSQQKAIALDAALKKVLNIKAALFHEGLPLVQRDRNAAWFAEEEGARLLICSEIGSEGRNFQFAHHLVLFDLPINPGLLEQRIGRLDRIGQTATIQIHVPYLVGSPQEFLADWYHQGLDAFESCAHGVAEYRKAFEKKALKGAVAYGTQKESPGRGELEKLIEETLVFRESLNEKLRRGRDRLLELNSFDPAIAEKVIEAIRESESDNRARELLGEVMDLFGVRIEEHEGGDVFLNSRHAYVDSYPQIPEEGLLATFERTRAIAREDIRFVSKDHPLFDESMELLINSEKGVASFALLESEESNLFLDAVFVLEAVADSKLHVERFIATTPLRVLVDASGRDLGTHRETEIVESELRNGSINRFLEDTGFSKELLTTLLDSAEAMAEKDANQLKKEARSRMRRALGGELERLIDLKRINPNVLPEEIELAKEEINGIDAAISSARLRLDSLRLIVQGEVDPWEV
ncbi:MAG: RNA polymerase-associated protein RapA [Opitutaceae bacterium]|nr:RNA polymerase-associated protein RapA [Opitutaceae bacterium]